eukprot:1774261-Prymnesium_polylepis.1
MCCHGCRGSTSRRRSARLSSRSPSRWPFEASPHRPRRLRQPHPTRDPLPIPIVISHLPFRIEVQQRRFCGRQVTISVSSHNAGAFAALADFVVHFEEDGPNGTYEHVKLVRDAPLGQVAERKAGSRSSIRASISKVRTRRLPPAACCLPPAICRLLFAACCLPPAVCRL